MPATTNAHPESISEYLIADHERIDRAFLDARRLAAERKLDEAVVAFDTFARGLRGHMVLEEEILFPVLEASLAIVGPTQVMRREHTLLEALLGPTGEALRVGDFETFEDRAAHLASLMASHNLKEERVLYPRGEASLDDNERAALLRRMMAH